MKTVKTAFRAITQNIPYLLIILIAAFYLANVTGGHDWGDDFSMYLMNARNIATGHPYVDTPFVYNVDTAIMGAKAYPPIFPLMLAPIIALWGVNFALLKIPAIACFILLLFYINKHVLPKNMTLPIRITYLILLGFSPHFFNQANSILSDIPFMLLCTISLKRINDHTSTSDPASGQAAGSLLTGILIYLSYGIKPIGLVLLPVLAAIDLLKRKRISLSTVMIAGVFILLVILQNLLIPILGDYFTILNRSIEGLAGVLAETFQKYFIFFSQIFYFKNFLIQGFIFLLLIELAIIGLLARARRGITSYDLFFFFSLASFLVWPGFQGIRYIMPIIPFYFLFILEGFQQLTTAIQSPRWLAKALPIALLAGISLYYLQAYAAILPRSTSELEQATTQEMFQVVRQRIGPDDVIAFFKPRVLALYTDRKSVALAIPAPNGDTFARMKELGVDYFILRRYYHTGGWEESNQLVRENPERFQLVFANDEFKIYRFLDGRGAYSPSGK